MFIQKLYTTARQFPHHTALVYGEQHMEYAQLIHTVEQCAQGLKTLPVTSTDRVALVLPNIPEFVISFFAIIGLEASVVPLNPQFKAEELRTYFQQCEVKAIITNEPTASACRDATAGWGEHIPVLVVERESQDYPSLWRLIEEQEAVQLPDCGSEKEAVFLYSSGTTGRSNGVARTQQQCYWSADSFTATARITEQDRIFCAVPLFHGYGIFTCLLPIAYTGATLLLFKEPNPFVLHSERALAWLEKERASILPGVPFLLRALIDTPGKADLSAVRLCISSAVPIPPLLFEDFYQKFNIPVRQLYGCTEASCISLNIDEHPEMTIASVGSALKDVDITIRDEQGQLLPVGQVGEITVRSPGAGRGYFGRDDLNRRVFRDGWYSTGDLGRMDAEGHLYITDRKSLIIEVAGQKVPPVQVEDVLVRHPKVREVVVVGVKNELEGDELIKAIIVPKEPCQAEELIHYCHQYLADFKVPRIVEFRDEIPKGPTGKIIRKYMI